MLSNEVSCWPSFSSTVPDYLWETAVSAVQIFWQGQIQIHAITPCFMFRIYLVLITVVMPISASFSTHLLQPSSTPLLLCFVVSLQLWATPSWHSRWKRDNDWTHCASRKLDRGLSKKLILTIQLARQSLQVQANPQCRLSQGLNVCCVFVMWAWKLKVVWFDSRVLSRSLSLVCRRCRRGEEWFVFIVMSLQDENVLLLVKTKTKKYTV